MLAGPGVARTSEVLGNCALRTSDWTVRREPTIFEVPGKGVFVPDLLFTHEKTGAQVYLEVFGYWSQASVFKRLEQLDNGFPFKVILAVSRKLRVSEEAEDDQFPGRILVCSLAISAHAVRSALEQKQEMRQSSSWVRLLEWSQWSMRSEEATAVKVGET